MPSTYQTLQSLLYSRKGIGVLFHASVKVVEVNAELQATIFLPYQYHRIAPCTLARPDSPRLQQLPEVVLNLLHQWQGNLPKLLFKGSVICNFYHVFGGSGYSPIPWGPMKRCHGTWPGAGRQSSPGLEAKNLTHSNPVHGIISHAFA